MLANKQARGAFGQGRMEAIVQDGLPKGAYEFQFTLSNGKRPDCVHLLPDQRPLVIDAKFPLEGDHRVARGQDRRRAQARGAARCARTSCKHVTDIAEKYLIPGETQDMALMFVPSESVYAELHDGFDDIVQKAYRAQVVHGVAVAADAGDPGDPADPEGRAACARPPTRSATEVGHLMKDVGRLGERVRKLQTHFGQANEDIRQILDLDRQDREARASASRQRRIRRERRRAGDRTSSPRRCASCEAGE